MSELDHFLAEMISLIVEAMTLEGDEVWVNKQNPD